VTVPRTPTSAPLTLVAAYTGVVCSVGSGAAVTGFGSVGPWGAQRLAPTMMSNSDQNQYVRHEQ
jgi:hypothetical protein